MITPVPFGTISKSSFSLAVIICAPLPAFCNEIVAFVSDAWLFVNITNGYLPASASFLPTVNPYPFATSCVAAIGANPRIHNAGSVVASLSISIAISSLFWSMYNAVSVPGGVIVIIPPSNCKADVPSIAVPVPTTT